MISDDQIDSIAFLVLNPTYGIDPNPEIYQEYLDILKPTKGEVDVTGTPAQNAACLTKILEFLVDGNTIEFALDQVSTSERFGGQHGIANHFLAYRDSEHSSNNTQENKDRCLKVLEGLAKYRCVSENIEEMKKSYDEIITQAGSGIEMYEKFVETTEKFSAAIQKTEDLYVDSSESSFSVGQEGNTLVEVGERLLNKFDKSKKIPSGFKYLDEEILYGGFDQTRLYTYAGNAGSGKSTILLNMAINGAIHTEYKGPLADLHKIFLYITLENDVEETLERMYCSRYSITPIQFRRQLKADVKGTTERFEEDMKAFNSTVYVKHFPSSSLTVQKLETEIKKLEEKKRGDPDKKVVAIYVDYLDLLKSISTKDLRFQLNEITQDLKEIARRNKLPVITATQLNRESYTAKSAYNLNPSMLAESIGKVFIADFMGFLARSQQDNLVFFKVGKNRSGPLGKPMDFKVNFEHFKFIECQEAEENGKKKTDSVVHSNPTEDTLKMVTSKKKSKFSGFSFDGRNNL